VYNAFNIDDDYSYKSDIKRQLELLKSEIDDFKQNEEIYKFLAKAGF